MKTTKAARAARRKRQRQVKGIAVSLVGVALLLVVAGLLLKQNPSVPVEVTGAPSLRVDTEQVDLGDVQLGKTVQVSFQLTNVGDQPLRLAKAPYVQVVEGCWPPVPTVGSTVIQPGKSTQLSLEFNMHGDMGGMHDFRVHVFTNDPNEPDKILTVLSNWVP